MSSEDAVFEALSHETRRRIIRILKEKPLAYSEMLEALGVETGALNYHLGKLKGLVEKSEDGTYRLTPLGVRAYEVLRCYEGGAGRKEGDKSVLSALSDMLLYPHRVYGNPDAYGFFTIIPAVLLFLLEYAETGNLELSLILVAAPLLSITSIAAVIYGAYPKDITGYLKAYPVSLIPLCAVPLLEPMVMLLPSRLDLMALLAVVAVYVAYTMLFIREVFGLDYSKSLVVSILNIVALWYISSHFNAGLLRFLFGEV